MDILTYKDFEGTAELDMDRGVCHGKLLFINDLVTYQSDSIGDLRRQFELAVDDYLETCRQLGREAQRPFRGQFNVRISPELHREAALRAITDDVPLNGVMTRALDVYLHGSRTEVTNHLHVMPQQVGVGVWTAGTAPGPSSPIRSWKGVAHGN